MPAYSPKFLLTQVGRGVALHFEPAPGGRRTKAMVRSGLLVGVQAGRLVVQLAGEQYPTHVDVEADQPAFATRERDGSALWWEWQGAQRPLPSGFTEE